MNKNILRSLFNKFGLFRLASKINSPKITAIILFLTCSIIKSKKRNVPTMIYIHKGIGVDDIKSMAQYSNEINYIILQSSFIREIFKIFFGSNIYDNKNLHIEYHVDKKNFPSSVKAKYRNFLSKSFNYLEKFIKYDGFICSNYVYSYLQELAVYAREENKLYVILYKEGLVHKNFLKNYINRYTNQKFIGDIFFTSNYYIKEALIESNIQGFNKDNIIPIGIPRLDYYKDLETSNKHIALFSFYPDDKFSYLEDKSYFNKDFKSMMNQIAENFHIYAIQYANQNPKKKLIIKTKFPKKYIKYVHGIIQRNNLFISKNIFITNDEDTTTIIRNASAILAYNSTTLLEALLLNKKIIIPSFSNILPHEHNIDYLIDYENIANTVSTYKDLDDAIKVDKSYDQKMINKILKDYILHTNFQASKNAENEIIRYIKNK
tara:strand:- start:9546 stop:10847 length:1302 start_codon:yes stop_codon:yes gene_type:complete